MTSEHDRPAAIHRGVDTSRAEQFHDAKQHRPSNIM
jgi:hypothetical protein